MQFLLIKVPKGNEYTIEQTYALLSNLIAGKKRNFFKKTKKSVYALEIICSGQKIYFLVGVPEEKLEFFKAQLLAQFKEAVIEKVKAPVLEANDLFFCQLNLSRDDYLPLKTTEEFKETDPLSSVLATMAKSANSEEFYLYQILLTPASKNWQDNLIKLSQTGGGKNEQGNYLPHPQKVQIEAKAKHPGFKTYLRILTNNFNTLNSLAGSFGIYTEPAGNSLSKKKPALFSKKKLLA